MKYIRKQLTNLASGIIYIIVGLILIFFSDFITPSVTYIFGGLLIFNAVIGIIQYFLNKAYKYEDNTSIQGVVLNLALGVLFMVYHELGMTLFALFWGLHAVVNAFEGFHKTAYALQNKQRWVYELVGAIVELVLGIMLFIEFGEGISTHLMLLGFYFAFVGVFAIFGIDVKKKEKQTTRPQDDLDYRE